MKTIKLFMVMSFMFIMGNVCIAQEEIKKDSIWGLEVSASESGIVVSFCAKVDSSRSWSVSLDFFEGENKYFRGVLLCYDVAGSYRNLSTKWGEVTSEDLGDSVVKLTWSQSSYTDSFLKTNQVTSLKVQLLYNAVKENILIYYFDFSDELSFVEDIKVDKEIRYKYYLLSGVECVTKPQEGFYIENLYIDGSLFKSTKNLIY